MDASITTADPIAVPPVVAPSRTLYRCCPDWEHSCYDDSDWYCVAYCPETGELSLVETGSTRHAGGTNHGGGVLPMIDEHRAAAREALIAIYVAAFTRQDTRDLETPGIELLTRGTKVRFVQAHSCHRKQKVVAEGPCPKCAGSGHWVNPRKASDKRPCFGCNGKGVAQVTTREKAKDAAGKIEWEHIDAGSEAEVLGQATFGRFYANGYNRPGRHNTTVYLRLVDGREVQAPAEKLALCRPLATAEEIRKRAEHAADHGLGFYGPFATSGVRLL